MALCLNLPTVGRLEDQQACVSVLFEVGQVFGLSERLTQFLWRVAAIS